MFYLRRTVGDDAGEEEEDPSPDKRKFTLAAYSLKDRKETVLGKVNAYEITADGKRMLVKVDKDYAVMDLPKDKLELKDKVKMSGLDMRLDHHAEWTQIYHEAWRQMRDFFYAPNMNGVNWPAMHDKYAALLPYVNHRNDLTYLIGELIAELNKAVTPTLAAANARKPRASSLACSGPSLPATPPRAPTASPASCPGRTGTRTPAPRSPPSA